MGGFPHCSWACPIGSATYYHRSLTRLQIRNAPSISVCCRSQDGKADNDHEQRLFSRLDPETMAVSKYGPIRMDSRSKDHRPVIRNPKTRCRNACALLPAHSAPSTLCRRQNGRHDFPWSSWPVRRCQKPGKVDRGPTGCWQSSQKVKKRNGKYHLLCLLLLLTGGRRTIALVLIMAEGASLIFIPTMAVYEDVSARSVLVRCICFGRLHKHAALCLSCLCLCLSGSRLTILRPGRPALAHLLPSHLVGGELSGGHREGSLGATCRIDRIGCIRALAARGR